MTRKTDAAPMLRGRAAHRRVQHDYMGALLDRVTLETWGEVIDATVTKAKEGDAQARAWLASYLMGRATMEAPEPLGVTASRIRGSDPLVDQLAEPLADRMRFGLNGKDEALDYCRETVAAELPAHIEPKP
ncbi:MAG: hypothetical protein JSR26_08435 [Proteobacteria bacterium]|nr:hypothetical protein [Pseudomonadota bacterium]